MSILENLIDKPAVVLDVGLAYTKCGFAGEYAPHSIISTPIDKELSKNYDPILLREALVEFIYRIYYKHLNANSRERKVVVIESILTPNKFRQTLAEVLFKDFHVVSVSFLSSHVSALYTLGIKTALIIDCGYSDCQVLPIAEGMQMTGLCDFLNLGAQRLHQHIAKLIREYGQIKVGTKVLPFKDVQPEPELNEEILEDIKIRCCFVTSFQRARQYEQELKSKLESNQSIENLEFKFISNCEYNLKNNLILIIPGMVRETALEILFKDYVDTKLTLQNLILETIVKCPIDLKKAFIQNIVLIGGTCMLTGFKHRLAEELKFLINDDKQMYCKELAFRNFKFHVPPSHDNYTAWLGGSIFGSLDTLDSYSISYAKHMEIMKLPDSFEITNKYGLNSINNN